MSGDRSVDLQVVLLGPVQARVDGRLVAVTSRLQRAVLAFLALNAGHVVSTTRLVDALWGERAPDTVMAALQVHVSGLRKALGPAAHLLATRSPGYVLTIAEANVDLLVFEAHARAARDSRSVPLAVEWTGEILADLPDVAFVPAVIARIEQLRWASLEDRAEVELDAGHHAAVVGDVEELLVDQPYRERLWRSLIIALYRSGRQADALAAYRRAARVLADDLGLDPGPGLVSVHQAVLTNDPVLLVPAENQGAARLPDGNAQVAVLMTDIVGSTTLWQRHASVMPTVLTRHHDLIQAAVIAEGGALPLDQGEGDSRLGVFTGEFAVADAALAGLAIHAAMAAEPWSDGLRMHVRIGIDEGEALVHRGNVFGVVVNRCSRVRALAHGGQVLVRTEREPERPGVTWTELGFHALRDVEGQVRLVQADGPSGPTVFPPLRMADRVRAPALPAGFVGRADEVRTLGSAVRAGAVVTVSAPGGMGKTSVAIAVAHESTVRFPNGAVFVDLVSIQQAADVGTAVALAFGPPEPGMTPWAAVAVATTGRPTLVVLDNCEQIDSLARVLAEQVPRLADVAWLATSRAPIGLVGEHVIALAPLVVPDDDVADEASLQTSAAGALLIARAREARADLVLDAPAAGDLAAIARRLDGHPLALELAAARLRFQSPAAVRQGLESTLEDLRDVSGRGDPRQQDLGAVLSWSIERLDDTALGLLDTLATFESATTSTALADVAGLDEQEAFAPLARLLDAGLARAVSTDSEPRFDTLVPIRAHVRHLWSSERRVLLLDRHASYHARWARHGSVQLHNTMRNNIWVSDSWASRKDALAALDHLQQRDASAALKMACDLMVLWEEHEDDERGRTVLTSLIAATTGKDEPYRTLARLLAAVLSYSRVDGQEIAALRKEIEPLDSPELESAVLLLLAFQEFIHGRPVAARTTLRSAREAAVAASLMEANGRPPLNGHTCAASLAHGADTLLCLLTRWRDAEGFAQLAEHGLRDCGGPDSPTFISWLREVFRAQVDMGRVAEAHRTAEKVATIPWFHLLHPEVSAALLAAREGHEDEALTLLRATPRAIGLLEPAAVAADVLLTQGRPEAALMELECVIDYPKNMFRSIASARIARVFIELGDLPRAVATLDEVETELADGEASPGALTYLVSRAMLAQGDERTRFLAEYDALVEATGVLPWPRDTADRDRLR